MMYPNPVNAQTSPILYSDLSVRSRAIYGTLLATMISIVIALPLISIEVGVHTSGMIRPAVQRTTLHAPVSGIIKTIPFQEEQQVSLGDTLLVIRSESTMEQLTRTERRIVHISNYLNDLDRLTERSSDELSSDLIPLLQSIRYRRSLMEYLQRQNRIRSDVQLREKQHQRNRTLAHQDLISQAELEESAYTYQKSLYEQQLLYRQQRFNWTLDREEMMKEQEHLKTTAEELRESLHQHTVISPLAGTLHSLFSLQPGSYLAQNQQVAEISPESELIAELYLPSDKAGLVEPGMTGRLRLDAFDDRQWGTIQVTVESFPDDISFDTDQPYYRLRCQLDRTWLELPGGIRREIRRGMTVQARLVIAERTLFQLLFDRLENWLNPMWHPAGNSKKTLTHSLAFPEEIV